MGRSAEDIDQSYEGKNKEILRDLEKDGWAMTPFVDRADYFKEQGYDVENKGGVFMIKPKDNKLDYEIVNDKSIDAIKDNFTPPGAEDEEKKLVINKGVGDVIDSQEMQNAYENWMGDAMLRADTNKNGEIEEDEMAEFQKSLDDYASKNKKGRDDIPTVTTRR